MDRPRYLVVCTAVRFLPRLRHLPFVRSRSSLELGFGVAFIVISVFGVGYGVGYFGSVQDPPDGLLEALAGVGGAVFIAYSAGLSPFVAEVRRNSESAFMVGLFTGLAVCGVIGIGIALVLIGASKPLTIFGGVALCWAAGALTCLALFVAALPLLAYERAHAKHFEADD